MMNGYEKHELEEDPFAPKSGNIVSAFDAFRMLLPSLSTPFATPESRARLTC